MSQAEENTLNAYVAAVESFEYLQTLLVDNQITSSVVTQQLSECHMKLDNIIEMENTNSDYMLKAQIKKLKEVITKKQSQNVVKDVMASKKIYLYSPSPCKRQKLYNRQDSSEKLLNLVKNTVETPKVQGLQEIAGLWEIKKTLKSLVVLPRFQPQLFENRKICNSVLLFGPPGTGKTRLVHALAADANAVLHSVSVGDLLSPLIGESEKTLQALFNFIKENNSFSILFIDEIDGICRKRNSTEQDYSRRIKTELMCQMSKIEENRNLFVICATNCPWDLDTAILRRFQKRLYIPLPNRAERCELLQLMTKNTALEHVPIDDFVEIIDKTNGYSGSDLSDLVQCALNIPLIELDDTKVWKIHYDGFYEPVVKDLIDDENLVCCELSDIPPNSVTARSVTTDDLKAAAEMVHMTVSQVDVNHYEAFIGSK